MKINNELYINNSSFLAPRSSEGSFFQYLQKINKIPLLTEEEEYDYAMKYHQNDDNYAAQMLVQSHLRLVVKIATKFRNYGLPVVDLVSEGNLGLMRAVKKFEPKKGFRFSTYAMWWIKSYIQEYILKSWSLVKIGTTAAQKKLFFNLKKIKNKLNAANEGNLLPEHIEAISNDLNVSKKEVINMNSRLQNSDGSLNRLIRDGDGEAEFIDQLESEYENQEELAIKSQQINQSEKLVELAFKKLNEREKQIISARQLSDKAQTLESLSKIYKISKERVRQIEAAALSKMKSEILSLQSC
jgi:RNA polymerase sigma-32 factor